MDARMDSGMNADEVLTLDEKLQQGKMPDESRFTAKNMVALFDHMLALMV
jgi:hypothetical protein